LWLGSYVLLLVAHAAKKKEPTQTSDPNGPEPQWLSLNVGRRKDGTSGVRDVFEEAQREFCAAPCRRSPPTLPEE
jgi:hypothetical protein